MRAQGSPVAKECRQIQIQIARFTYTACRIQRHARIDVASDERCNDSLSAARGDDLEASAKNATMRGRFHAIAVLPSLNVPGAAAHASP